MPSHWQPFARRDVLAARAELYALIRRFFTERGVLEVETPIASRAAVTDPALESLATRWCGPGGGGRLYLQTSPELPMKRLLAAGSGPIYQICKVFRDGERGRLHHPEFSLLEWYRPGWNYSALMDEVSELVAMALGVTGLSVERVGYRELFVGHLGLDPWESSAEGLRQAALRLDIPSAVTLDLDRDGWLDLLLAERIQGRLGRGHLSFVIDYPPSQAALARVRPGPPAVAERFELYLEGVELANGFQELTDALAQRDRFDADLAIRHARGQPEVPADEAFLAALAAGMPETSGVALGLDRLLMARLAVDHIDAVLAFPVERA